MMLDTTHLPATTITTSIVASCVYSIATVVCVVVIDGIRGMYTTTHRLGSVNSIVRVSKVPLIGPISIIIRKNRTRYIFCNLDCNSSKLL